MYPLLHVKPVQNLLILLTHLQFGYKDGLSLLHPASKKSRWKLQGFLCDLASGVPEHHFHHILLANQVIKANPDLRGGELKFTSQWEV